jgi:hypothetical protein
MYLALFFAPWMLMYSLSTIAMNHRAFFEDVYAGENSWEREQQQTYPGTFPDDADPKMEARQVLSHLHLDGSFGARKAPGGKSYTIVRQDPIVPRRITYSTTDHSLVVERQIFRTPVFLERMHRLRGYESEFVLNDIWGLSVDLIIVAMVLWVLSGLWMWWELKVTRIVGALFFLAGTGIFVFFLSSI